MSDSTNLNDLLSSSDCFGRFRTLKLVLKFKSLVLAREGHVYSSTSCVIFPQIYRL